VVCFNRERHGQRGPALRVQALPEKVAVIACIARHIQLGGQQFAPVQPHLDVDVRRAPVIGRRPQRAKAVAPVASHGHAAKALERRVSLATVARVVIVARLVALPDFHHRAGHRPARCVQHCAFEPGRLAARMAGIAVAQQVKVAVSRQRHRVERPFGLARGGLQRPALRPGGAEPGRRCRGCHERGASGDQ